MTNKIILTIEGFEKLKKELDELKKIKQPKALERLRKARSLGDLTESSEYTAAKEDLNLIEKRVEEIEEVLEKAEIVKNKQGGQIIHIGNKVTIEINGQKEQFLIVGEFEAEPAKKKISYASPIGKALMGKKVGEVVEVEAPAGKIRYKIINIQ
jgi:transcription elongation factor GreA